MADHLIVMTTVGADTDATAFASTLVEERLAACVNILPGMISVYRWKGGVSRDPEQQLLIKTSADRLDPLRARLEALHPYEVPEILVLAVADGGADYLSWVTASTRP